MIASDARPGTGRIVHAAPAAGMALRWFLSISFLAFALLLPPCLTALDVNDPSASTDGGSLQNGADSAFIEQQLARLQEDMVVIPGGGFMMGADSSDAESDEVPVHRVDIHRFRMGRYEVSFAQWDACTADGGCDGHRAYDKGWGRGKLPVIHVTWDDTQNFISWLNRRTGKHYRLPSEAEWEYAARAGTHTRYSWGDYIGSGNANCRECGGTRLMETTLPVGSYAANAFGLYDMHGNVWEWVQDCWNGNYRGAPTDGSAWLSGDCKLRVIRGGSYFSTPALLRSANRSFNPRTRTVSEPGFRLALD